MSIVDIMETEVVKIEDRIFEMEIKADKNSKEFDLSLLEELKSLVNIPVNKFDTMVRQIMKKKSSCKLWFDNKPVKEWNGKEYQEVNYRCCPSSHKARYFFCLMLDRREDGITVTDGFLRAV